MSVEELERLRIIAQAKSEAYQQMSRFVQDAIDHPSWHSQQMWKQIAGEYHANILNERDQQERESLRWVELDAMSQVYNEIFEAWQVEK